MSHRTVGIVAWWIAAVSVIALPIAVCFGASRTHSVAVSTAVVRASIGRFPELKDDFDKDFTGPRGTADPPGGSNSPAVVPRGLRFEIDPQSVAMVDERYAVTVHTTTNCQPCERLKAALKDDLRLSVTLAPINHVPHGVPLSSFPFITFRDSAGTLRYNSTARTADAVVALIERASATATRRSASELKAFASTYNGPHVGVTGMTVRWHLTNPPHGYSSDQLAGLSETEMLAIHSGDHYGQISPHGARSENAVSSRASGQTRAVSISGKGVIQSALAKWREKIGDGVVSATWRRNGSQTLPLLRLSEWKPTAIYGTSGEFEMKVIGAPHSLPVKDATIDYRISGDVLRLRGEVSVPSSVIGITDGEVKSVGSSQVVGMIDPISLLSAASLIWSLLHPQADITLPGTIRATASMSGDSLVVKFTDAPSLKIVVLFAFHLKVESVTISEREIVMKFSGSRWITQKTFTVTE